MLFGEEVISYAWHQVWKQGTQTLSIDRCATILRDHKAILNAIRRSNGTNDDIQLAKRTIERHLLGTFVRNSFDEAFLELVIKEEEARIPRLEEILDFLKQTSQDTGKRNTFRYSKDDH